jgi:glutamine synthetase
MVLIARQMVQPAVVTHQANMADSIFTAERAGANVEAQKKELLAYAHLVNSLCNAVEDLDSADDVHGDDPLEQTKYMRENVLPRMDALREVVDALEMKTATDLWPLPSYRDLLFTK